MSHADTERDALALIKAVIGEDHEAAEVILDHSDLRAVAEEMALRTALLTVADCGSRERALAAITEIQRSWAAGEAAT